MKPTSIKTRIKQVAKAAYITPTEEMIKRVEEEVEKEINKLVTSELLEKIRIELIKSKKNDKLA